MDTLSSSWFIVLTEGGGGEGRTMESETIRVISLFKVCGINHITVRGLSVAGKESL